MRTVAMLLAAAATVSAGSIKWERDFQKARERAALEGKLLFIGFSADW